MKDNRHSKISFGMIYFAVIFFLCRHIALHCSTRQFGLLLHSAHGRGCSRIPQPMYFVIIALYMKAVVGFI